MMIESSRTAKRPNVVVVLADDHATSAISAYGSQTGVTPSIDRLATEGARLDSCFCTNALCSPSRASILTGTYSHVNNVTTLETPIDARQVTFPWLLQAAGYQTSLFGKWHLGHGGNADPRGFDTWEVLPGQGRYFDPDFITSGGRHTRPGYVTDIVTDLALDWIAARDRERPFCTIVSHKAPHVPMAFDRAHADLYPEAAPLPRTFLDDYRSRSSAATRANMRIADIPASRFENRLAADLTGNDLAVWKYQQLMRDYLRCCASIDDNLGRLLDALQHAGIADDTIVIYTSDQGYFLGEHGWRDKRFMYEAALRMPFLIRYPREIPPGTQLAEIITNVDFAPTLCDYSDVPVDPRMQGRSFRPLLRREHVGDWPTSMYYRYWMNDDPTNHVTAHYGIRTHRHKLIYYYGDGLGLPGTSAQRYQPEWELFDLDNDPDELSNVYDDPAYVDVQHKLKAELEQLQRTVGDNPYRPC